MAGYCNASVVRIVVVLASFRIHPMETRNDFLLLVFLSANHGTARGQILSQLTSDQFPKIFG